MTDTPFCIWPWFHQKVNTNGSAVPCCSWAVDPSISTAQHHLEFFNSQFMQSLRQDFSQHRVPDNCSSCVYYDQFGFSGNSTRDQGFELARQLKLDLNSDPVLLSQEVDLSNLCNLRCRSCDQQRSTKWISDAVRLGEQPVGLIHAGWQLTDSQAQTVKRLAFLGGEPLLHQEDIADQLDKIAAADRLTELSLHFTSNMTVPLSSRLVDILRKVKLSRIDCSIDGYGDMNEYVRSDSKWIDISANVSDLARLRKEIPTLVQGANFTYSVFNAAGFDQFQSWWSQFGNDISVSLVTGPSIHDARNLPDSFKQSLILDYRSSMQLTPKFERAYATIISHLAQSATMDFISWRSKLKHQTAVLDELRSVRLADVYPQLSELME